MIVVGDADTIRANITNAVGRLFFAVMCPALNRTSLEYDMTLARLDAAQLVLALTAYKADNCSYPQTLAELSPMYLQTVPENMFTGQPLDYQRHEDGYRLSCPIPSPYVVIDDITIQVPVPVVEEVEKEPPQPPSTLRPRSKRRRRR